MSLGECDLLYAARVSRYMDQWQRIKGNAAPIHNLTLAREHRDVLDRLYDCLDDLPVAALGSDAQQTLAEIRGRLHSLDVALENCVEEKGSAGEGDEQVDEDEEEEIEENCHIETANGNDGEQGYQFIKSIQLSLFGELQHRKDPNGKNVAVKVSRRDLMEQGISISGKLIHEDPVNEAELMRLLPQNDHVISIIDSFNIGDEFWIIMEFAERGEFYEILNQAGRLDEDVAKIYFKQLLLGLKHLHDHGVCHLDLSMENLLMDSAGRLKICDLGLARRIEAAPFAPCGGFKPGKLKYMAPEIYEEVPYSGAKADVFSCGVILFILLTGFPPFDSPSQSDARFVLIMNGKLRQLLKRWRISRMISCSAAELLSQMLCKEEKRLSVDEVLAHEWLA